MRIKLIPTSMKEEPIFLTFPDGIAPAGKIILFDGKHYIYGSYRVGVDMNEMTFHESEITEVTEMIRIA